MSSTPQHGIALGSEYRIAEWSLESAVDDPFNQVTVDLLVTDPSGREQ